MDCYTIQLDGKMYVQLHDDFEAILKSWDEMEVEAEYMIQTYGCIMQPEEWPEDVETASFPFDLSVYLPEIIKRFVIKEECMIPGSLTNGIGANNGAMYGQLPYIDFEMDNCFTCYITWTDDFIYITTKPIKHEITPSILMELKPGVTVLPVDMEKITKNVLVMAIKVDAYFILGRLTTNEENEEIKNKIIHKFFTLEEIEHIGSMINTQYEKYLKYQKSIR